MSLVVRELTPVGSGAVAVLELEGEGALAAAEVLAGRAIALGVPVLARLTVEGEVVDEALVCAFSPSRVELHVHGSPALVRLLREHLEPAGTALRGARAATLEERALQLVPAAECEAAARILLDQSRGVLRAELERVARLDRPERARAIDELLERARVSCRALRPALVVLAGPVNAGKSTLFNALLGTDRAITSSVPGTTRDAIVERARFGEWPVDLCDTAGDRIAAVAAESVHAVEQAGQRLARAWMQRADLVLWLVPAGELVPAPVVERGIVRTLLTQPDRRPGASLEASVASRRDEVASLRDPVASTRDQIASLGVSVAISALRDPDGARAAVAAVFREALGLPERAWSPAAPVPFDEALVRGLVEARAADSSAAARAHLAAWLGAGAR